MKIKLWIATQKVGSECSRIIDFEDEEWAEMSDRERDQVLLEELLNSELFGWGYDEQ